MFCREYILPEELASLILLLFPTLGRFLEVLCSLSFFPKVLSLADAAAGCSGVWLRAAPAASVMIFSTEAEGRAKVAELWVLLLTASCRLCAEMTLQGLVAL